MFRRWFKVRPCILLEFYLQRIGSGYGIGISGKELPPSMTTCAPVI